MQQVHIVQYQFATGTSVIVRAIDQPHFFIPSTGDVFSCATSTGMSVGRTDQRSTTLRIDTKNQVLEFTTVVHLAALEIGTEGFEGLENSDRDSEGEQVAY